MLGPSVGEDMRIIIINHKNVYTGAQMTARALTRVNHHHRHQRIKGNKDKLNNEYLEKERKRKKRLVSITEIGGGEELKYRK